MPAEKKPYKITIDRTGETKIKPLESDATLAATRTALGALMNEEDQFSDGGALVDIEDEGGLKLSDIVAGPANELRLENPKAKEKEKNDDEKKADDEAREGKLAAELQGRKDRAEANAAGENTKAEAKKKKLEDAASKISTATYKPTLTAIELPDDEPAADHTPGKPGISGAKASSARSVVTELTEAEQRKLLERNRIDLNHGPVGTGTAFIINDGLQWAKNSALEISQVKMVSPDHGRMDHLSYAYSEYESRLQQQMVAAGSSGVGVPLLFRVDASYRRSEASSTLNKQVEIHMQASQLVPKARVIIKDEHIAVSEEFVAAIKKALSGSGSRALPLLNVLESYGQFVGTDLLLGGRITLTTQKTLSDSYTRQIAQDEFTAAADARFESAGVPVEAGGGAGWSNKSHSSTKAINQNMSLKLELKGGDEATASSNSDELGKAWIPTLAQFAEWRVVGFYKQSLVPILDYLDDELRDECLKVLKAYFNSRLVPFETAQFGQKEGGYPFEPGVADIARIAKIEVNYGTNIDGLRFTYELKNGKGTHVTDWTGYLRGEDSKTIELEQGEGIAAIELAAQSTVHRIAFRTTKGRRFPPTGYYGKHSDSPNLKTISAPRVIGFVGRNHAFLHQIGLQYLDLDEATPFRAYLHAMEPYLFGER